MVHDPSMLSIVCLEQMCSLGSLRYRLITLDYRLGVQGPYFCSSDFSKGGAVEADSGDPHLVALFVSLGGTHRLWTLRVNESHQEQLIQSMVPAKLVSGKSELLAIQFLS